MFIDTNVLVNSRVAGAPHHDAARSNLERAFRDPEPLRISRQVMREYLAVVTRPQTWPVAITREEALEDVHEETEIVIRRLRQELTSQNLSDKAQSSQSVSNSKGSKAV